MSFSKLRKKYVILLWIGVISLFVGHFYLSSLYPDHQNFYSNTLLVVLGLLFLLYVLMNKWFGKEALKILNASTGIDFWYEWSQSGNRARFSISKQSARLASVVYCYMIGDFSSAIDRIEYLQNQNIAKTDRSSLLGIFIKSSLLSGKGISKEEIQKKFSYISFKDEAEKDEALQKQLAIYDILVDQQPNDYFDHVRGSQAFQRLENRYFKGLNAQLRGELVQATSLFKNSGFGRTLTIPGLLVIYSLIGIIDGMIIRKRISSIRTRLYEEPTDNGSQSKQIQLVTGFAGGIVAIWMVLKFFFPQIGEVRTDILGVVSVIGMVFLMNVIFLAMYFILLLPHSLYGYYRNKYSEEYREFEGKSLEEWYGKKYLRKHKELMESNNEEINL